MNTTHFARINASSRIVPVTRWGRCLVIHHGGNSVSLCTYDHRFTLYPKGTKLMQHGEQLSLICPAVGKYPQCAQHFYEVPPC